MEQRAVSAPSSSRATSRPSWLVILAVAAPQFAVNGAYAAEYAIANPIQARLGFPHWSWPVINLVDPLVGIFAQLLVGRISDIKMTRIGRRLPWILGGLAFFAIGCVLLAFVESMSSSMSVRRGLYILFFILINLGINVMQSPSESVVQDLLPNDVVLVQSIGSALMGVGLILTNLPGGVTGLSGSSFQPTTMVLIVSVVFIVGSIALHCVAAPSEPKDVELEDVAFGNPIKDAWRIMCDPTLVVPQMRLACVVFFFEFCSYVPWMVVMADFFGWEIYGGDAVTALPLYNKGVWFGMLTMAVSATLGTIYCLFQDSIVRWIGIRNALAITHFAQVVAFLPAPWLRNRWALMALFSLGATNCMAAVSLMYGAVARFAPGLHSGVYCGILNIALETGGYVGQLAFQLGIGSIWSSRAPTIFCSGLAAVVGTVLTMFLKIPGDGCCQPDVVANQDDLLGGESVPPGD